MLITAFTRHVSLAARRHSFLSRRRTIRAPSVASVGLSLLSVCSVGLVRCMCGNSASSMSSQVVIQPMGTHTATVSHLTPGGGGLCLFCCPCALHVWQFSIQYVLPSGYTTYGHAYSYGKSLNYVMKIG